MAEPTFCAIALGSNLGDRERTICEAVVRIGALKGTQTLAVSQRINTSPVGNRDQPDFLNAAMSLTTTLSPVELLSALHGIERDFGRDRSLEHRWGPRTLDLDVLLYGDVQINSPGLTIPHPRMLEREFVLGPLAEIAPDHILQGGLTVSQAYERLRTMGVKS